MNDYHIPVMLKEVISFLEIKKEGWYIDCNLGGGGHTEGILKSGGKVLGIDLDPEAISEVAKKYSLQINSKQMVLIQSNFSNLKEIVRKFNPGPINGILFDLGVSSHQLEEPDRGFSFNVEAPLDMRMDPNSPVKASDLINGLLEHELAELFWNLGEERFAKPIAKRIVEYRQKKPIEGTNELANIILSIRHKSKGDRTHPATRIFQALRIAVNDELNSLRITLPQAMEILGTGGRLAVISFHSLEDRIVKNFFKDEQNNGKLKILTKKPVTPADEEVENNPRSRSGKLRAAEKI